jgi:hypothetical protein
VQDCVGKIVSTASSDSMSCLQVFGHTAGAGEKLEKYLLN